MASTTSGRLTFQTLPMELLCLICRLLNHEDLRKLRLTARFFKDMALAEMFRIQKPPNYIYLAPYKYIIDIFVAMAKSPLQSYCTTLCLNMDKVPAGEESFWTDTYGTDHHNHETCDLTLPDHCLDSIACFQSVQAVHLDTSLCADLGALMSLEMEVIEGVERFEKIFLRFGEALRRAVLGNTTSARRVVLEFDHDASMPRSLADSLKPGISKIVHLEIVDDRQIPLRSPVTCSVPLRYSHELWMSALTTAPKIQELSFTCNSRPSNTVHPHLHSRVRPPGFFTDVVFPSWDIFSRTAPLWPSLTKLHLIGVVLNNSDLMRTCRIIRLQLRELFMIHVLVRQFELDCWRECYPSWDLSDPKYRDALDFLRHLSALHYLRVELCKSFYEEMWGKEFKDYIAVAKIDAYTLVEERCSYALCGDICYDVGPHYLEIIDNRI